MYFQKSSFKAVKTKKLDVHRRKCEKVKRQKSIVKIQKFSHYMQMCANNHVGHIQQLNSVHLSEVWRATSDVDEDHDFNNDNVYWNLSEFITT